MLTMFSQLKEDTRAGACLETTQLCMVALRQYGHVRQINLHSEDD